MKKLALLLAVTLLLGESAFAQGQVVTTGAPNPKPFAGAPTGACGQQDTAVDTTTGNFYSCKNGTWQLVSGGVTPGSVINPSKVSGVIYVDGTTYTTLAQALAAMPNQGSGGSQINGAIIYDTVPETWNTNPLASMPAGTSARIFLGPGVWTTNVTLALTQLSTIITGAGRADGANRGTRIKAGASFPTNTPVITESTSGMAMRVENLTIDCNNISGATGIKAAGAQEQSGAVFYTVENCPAAAVDLESGSQNIGWFRDGEIFCLTSNCGASTVGFKINNIIGLRGIKGLTVNFSGAPSTPTNCITVDSSVAITIEGIHVEGCTNGINIGATTANAAIYVNDVSCGNFVAGNVVNCVNVATGNQDIDLHALKSELATNLLVDVDNSRTITNATDVTMAVYYIGNGSNGARTTITSSVNFASLFWDQLQAPGGFFTNKYVAISAPGYFTVGSGGNFTSSGSGGTVGSVGTQASAATNFGTALGAQTLIASVPNTGEITIQLTAVQILAGVGCGAGTNTATPTVSWTAPGGTAESATAGAANQLSMSANGAVDTGASTVGLSTAILAKAGTAVTYTVASTLASAGCSTVPQYTVYAKAHY